VQDVSEICRCIYIYMYILTTSLRHHWNDGSDWGNYPKIAELFSEVKSYNLSSYKNSHPGVDRIIWNFQTNLTRTGILIEHAIFYLLQMAMYLYLLVL